MRTTRFDAAGVDRAWKAGVGILTAGILMVGGPVLAESEEDSSFGTFGGSVMMATDYVFRGISNSNEEFQVQGDFNWSHSSGFYTGVWASNTDFGGPGNSMELDPYLGFAGSFGDSGLSYDVGYWAYTYPGSTSDLDYGEAYAIGTYSAGSFYVSPSVWYADNYFGSDFLDGIAGIAYDVTVGSQLPGGFDVSARMGEQTFDSAASGLDYRYYDVGVSKSLGDFSFGLRWHDTDDVQPGLAPANLADGRLVLSVTRGF